MKILIRQAKIIDSASDHHQAIRDVLINGDRIQQVGTDLPADGARIIEVAGQHLSPGWLDMGVQIGDPGFEHREDIESVSEAAAAGGFTAIGAFPNTEPVIHAKPEVNYLLKQSRLNLVDILPIGAITQDCAGKDITEMIDMYRVGAVAFSDGSRPIQNNGMMMRALQYVKAFSGIVINQPHDQSISGDGQMHEGQVSTSLGMKGIPNMAEEMMVQRDIYLADYTASRVHLSAISSARSVYLIRQAKADGVDVSCSVPALNLAYDDQSLADFNALFKVLPPLRAASDQEGLIDGLLDGTIDMITANHVPLEEEQKKLEFAYAGFGAIGLETAFALINTRLSERIPLPVIIRTLSHRPRALFSRTPVRIATGERADLTLFHPDLSWTVSAASLYSKSRNTPLMGQSLRGKVLGVMNNGQSLFPGLT